MARSISIGSGGNAWTEITHAREIRDVLTLSAAGMSNAGFPPAW